MFSIQQLQDDGFEGFLRLDDPTLRHAAPTASGVYVVLRDTSFPSRFLPVSVGGHFKSKDPSVAIDVLSAKDVPGCPVVYIGRGNDINARLRLLSRFGAGEPVAHWGGRYLWQLSDHSDLRVAWLPDDNHIAAEANLLDAFEATFGRLPFANLVRGRRLVS